MRLEEHNPAGILAAIVIGRRHRERKCLRWEDGTINVKILVERNWRNVTRNRTFALLLEYINIFIHFPFFKAFKVITFLLILKVQ